jgi:type II restriction/modification system DNA methylase subunit YeeA
MQFYATDSKSLFLLSIRNSVLIKLIHLAANNNKNYKTSTKLWEDEVLNMWTERICRIKLASYKDITDSNYYIYYTQTDWIKVCQHHIPKIVTN